MMRWILPVCFFVALWSLVQTGRYRNFYIGGRNDYKRVSENLDKDDISESVLNMTYRRSSASEKARQLLGAVKTTRHKLLKDIHREVTDLKCNVLPGIFANGSCFDSMQKDVRFTKDHAVMFIMDLDYLKRQNHMLLRNVTDTRRDHKRMGKVLWSVKRNVTKCFHEIVKVSEGITRMHENYSSINSRLENAIEKAVEIAGLDETIKEMNAVLTQIKLSMNFGPGKIYDEVSVVRSIVSGMAVLVGEIKDLIVAGFERMDLFSTVTSNFTTIGLSEPSRITLATITNLLVDLSKALIELSLKINGIGATLTEMNERSIEFDISMLRMVAQMDDLANDAKFLNRVLLDMQGKTNDIGNRLEVAMTRLSNFATNVDLHFKNVNVQLAEIRSIIKDMIQGNCSFVRPDGVAAHADFVVTTPPQNGSSINDQSANGNAPPPVLQTTPAPVYHPEFPSIPLYPVFPNPIDNGISISRPLYPVDSGTIPFPMNPVDITNPPSSVFIQPPACSPHMYYSPIFIYPQYVLLSSASQLSPDHFRPDIGRPMVPPPSIIPNDKYENALLSFPPGPHGPGLQVGLGNQFTGLCICVCPCDCSCPTAKLQTLGSSEPIAAEEVPPILQQNVTRHCQCPCTCPCAASNLHGQEPEGISPVPPFQIPPLSPIQLPDEAKEPNGTESSQESEHPRIFPKLDLILESIGEIIKEMDLLREDLYYLGQLIMFEHNATRNFILKMVNKLTTTLIDYAIHLIDIFVGANGGTSVETSPGFMQTVFNKIYYWVGSLIMQPFAMLTKLCKNLYEILNTWNHRNLNYQEPQQDRQQYSGDICEDWKRYAASRNLPGQPTGGLLNHPVAAGFAGSLFGPYIKQWNPYRNLPYWWNLWQQPSRGLLYPPARPNPYGRSLGSFLDGRLLRKLLLIARRPFEESTNHPMMGTRPGPAVEALIDRVSDVSSRYSSFRTNPTTGTSLRRLISIPFRRSNQEKPNSNQAPDSHPPKNFDGWSFPENAKNTSQTTTVANKTEENLGRADGTRRIFHTRKVTKQAQGKRKTIKKNKVRRKFRKNRKPGKIKRIRNKGRKNDYNDTLQGVRPYVGRDVPRKVIKMMRPKAILPGIDVGAIKSPFDPFAFQERLQRYIDSKLTNAIQPDLGRWKKGQEISPGSWYGQSPSHYPLHSLLPTVSRFPFVRPPINTRPHIPPISILHPPPIRPLPIPHIIGNVAPGFTGGRFPYRPYSASYSDGKGNSWNVNVNVNRRSVPESNIKLEKEDEVKKIKSIDEENNRVNRGRNDRYRKDQGNEEKMDTTGASIEKTMETTEHS